MPRFRVEVQADATLQLMRAYVELVPLALDHLLTELARIDGHASQVPGHGDATASGHSPTFVDDQGRPLRCGEVEGFMVDGEVEQRRCNHARPCPHHDSSVPMTSVDRAVLARAEVISTLRQVEDDARAVASVLQSALFVARQALGQRAPRIEVPQCNRGVGRDGVIEWGRPWCVNVPDETRAGMCDECWQAETAWREAHELAPRHRTAPARPPAPTCSREGCTRDATPGRTDGLCDAHRKADSRARIRAAGLVQAE